MKKVLLFILPAILFASSLYLPIDNPLMNDVEKMAVIANMPTAKKPYSLKMIKIYNKKIETSHPELYKNIDDEISRLTGTFAKERLTASFAISDGNRAIPNSHGKDINSSYDFQATYFFNPSNYFQASIDLNAYEKDDELKIATNNSYLSLGWDYFQIDAGYRDHWYGPAYSSALAFSTNSINSPSVSLSNTIPISFLSINYEMMLTHLEKTDGIAYNSSRYYGNPKVFGLHLDISFVEWLTFGVNRMIHFGGGPRRDDINGLLQAFFDPNKYDNTSEAINSDEEYGNQITTISIETKFQGNVPFKIYAEIGAEDTGGEQVNKYDKFTSSIIKFPAFGNASSTIGIFFPYVTKNLSLIYEYTEMQNGWYVHHLYQNGYRNNSNVLGHWVGDTKQYNDGVGNNVNTLILNLDQDIYNIKTIANEYSHESYTKYSYSKGYDLSISTEFKNYSVKLVGGLNTHEESFYHLILSYYWK